MISKLSFVILVAMFLCNTVTANADHDKYDCGFTGIDVDQCLAKGCVWIENFPGPWCQTADSPYIPGKEPANADQLMILNFSIISFVSLCVVMLFAKRISFMNIDWIAVSVLMAISAVTRYYAIDHPKEVAFDEHYFGQFANNYCNSIYFFDIHPPLAKLTHYFVGSLLGAKCTMDFHGKTGPLTYSDPLQYVPYRLVSAFFGTVVIPLAYLVGRKLNFSVASSLLLSTLVFCDPLLLSETRLIMTDSQLFFYIVLSIFCALNLWQSKESSVSRNFWTVATAVASGCAFGVKFTALATLGWIAFGTYVAVYTTEKPIGLVRCLFASVIAAIVFVIPFWFHFKFGIYTGREDWNLDRDHQKLLIGNPFYDANAVTPSFFSNLTYLIRRMLEQNAASLGDHPYASFWYEWVFGKGSLLAYAEHDNDADWHGHIFIVASVFICYGIIIAIFAFFPVALTLLRIRTTRTLSKREYHFIKTGFMLFLGYFANLFPYTLVARSTYSYHYLPGQFFGMLIISLLVEDLPHFLLAIRYKGKQLARLENSLRVVLVGAAMAFLFWTYYQYSCYSYGFGINLATYHSRRWAVSGQ